MDMPKKGDEFVGSHGIYVLQEMRGFGANGAVFDITVRDPGPDLSAHGSGYVIKILTLSDQIGEEERAKRKERFNREIRAVLRIRNMRSSSGLAVVPIVDSYLEVEHSDRAWYVMPKAEDYRSRDVSAIERLKQMKSLGVTLQALHRKKIYHRDIKPANLLFYDKKCCLADFGLVWSRRDDHITGENEPLGPLVLCPPEMEHNMDGLSEETDFRKVDSYLFVKTLWIVLTGNRSGFKGEYRRSEKMIYLDRTKLDLGETLEPLHRMMEAATVPENAKRITVPQCLEYIDCQISIAEGRTDARIVEALLFDEKTKEAAAQISTDVIVFENPAKITAGLSKMEGLVDLAADAYGEQYSLGRLEKTEHISENVYEICLGKGSKAPCPDGYRRIRMNIARVSISAAGVWTIETDRMDERINETDDAVVNDITSLIRTNESVVWLDGKSAVTLKKP